MKHPPLFSDHIVQYSYRDKINFSGYMKEQKEKTQTLNQDTSQNLHFIFITVFWILETSASIKLIWQIQIITKTFLTWRNTILKKNMISLKNYQRFGNYNLKPNQTKQNNIEQLIKNSDELSRQGWIFDLGKRLCNLFLSTPDLYIQLNPFYL